MGPQCRQRHTCSSVLRATGVMRFLSGLLSAACNFCCLISLDATAPCFRICRLCLVQYEKERYSGTAFMDLFNKLNITLTDEQLSVFAGA